MNSHGYWPRFCRLSLPVLLTALSACATDRQVIRQAADANRELEPAILTDPELAGYFEKLGERIVTAAKAASEAHEGPKSHFEEDNAWMFTNKEFHLVNSETLNAFTTGGDHMYIYSELLETCRSEDELAAVMAHEFAHVYCRHVHKGMNRQIAAAGLSAGAGLAGLAIGGEEKGAEYASLAAVSTSVATSFLNMGYTRDDEAEADEWGFVFYTRAGWDPARFGDFFQQLIDKGLDTTPELLSDHPSLASRVKAAHVRANELPREAESWRRPPLADAQAFAALQQRTARIAKTQKTSDQLAAAQTLLSAVPSCVLPVDQPEQKHAQRRLAETVNRSEPQAKPAQRRR